MLANFNKSQQTKINPYIVQFCPVCRTPLRNQTFSFSQQLDRIVEQYAFQIFNLQNDQKEMS